MPESSSISEHGKGIVPVRARAAQAVFQVAHRGASLDGVVNELAGGLKEEDRSLLRELSFGSLRWFWRCKGVVDQLVRQPLKKRDGIVEAVMVVGVYQLEHMRLPSRAVIHSTVEACAALNRPGLKGLVNGVLRNFQRNGSALIAALPECARDAHPSWLWEAIAREWPAHAPAIIDANNTRPPMTLRVNTRLVSVAEYLEALRKQGIQAQVPEHVPTAVTLDKPVKVDRLPGFDQGRVSVQDASAQLLPSLLSPARGDRILDACAAPGGKLTHLLEAFPDCEIQAIELDPSRARRINENLERLRFEARTTVADAADTEAWWDGRGFDIVVLDVPCSGTGVIRRHPDIKVLRRESDIPQFARAQRHLLDRLWRVVAPGGCLVYVSCSILSEENQDQVADFLERTPSARERPVSLPTGEVLQRGCQMLPSPGSGDGFYYAMLGKQIEGG